MSLFRAFAALVVAAFTPWVAVAVAGIVMEGDSTSNLDEPVGPVLVMGLLAFISALALVFPILVFVPRLRLPSYPVAVGWGGLTGTIATATIVITEPAYGLKAVPFLALLFSGFGVVCGLVYRFTAGRLVENSESSIDRS